MSVSELQQLFATNMAAYSPTQIVLNLLMTMVLSGLIYVIYKKTYTGVLYSKSFNVTIMLITLVTAMVIMIISGNLVLSLGMVGALSIIRFRSAIKDPKDIGFLFWGIGVGLATGTGAYLIAIIGSIIIAIIMLLMHLGRFDDSAYLLIVKGKDVNYEQVQEQVKAGTQKFRLRMRNTLGNEQEVIYEIKAKKDLSMLVETLQGMENVHTVHLVTYNGEVNN